MAYNPNNSNGQKTSANSAPVVIASDQSAVPISAASLPLPSTAATSTKQSDGSQKTQVVDGSGNVIGATSNALDINIKSGNPTSITANAGTNLNTSSLALETGGNLATVKTNTDNLGLSQGSTTSGQKGNLAFGATTTSAPTYTTAQSNPLSLTTSGALRVDSSGSTQPVSGTVTVQQSTASSLKVDLSGTAANATAIKVDGSASTQPVSGTVTANAGTNLNTSALALETGGNLASVKTNTDNLALSQASTTSGQKGPIVQAAVTTSAPTYTTGQTDPLSMTTSGALRVDGSGATQPISASSLPLPTLAATSTKQSDGSQKTQVVDGSGNVIGSTSNALDINIKSGNPTSITANAGTNLNTSALALDATLTGGTAKAIVRGGAKGTTTAADVTSTSAGSNNQTLDVGILDASGNRMPSMDAVSRAGNVKITDGTNTQTFMSTTTSSKFGADTNILSILGTAPTSAGKLDVKGADGDVFVRQTTASNLNAQIVGPTGPSATLSSNPVTTGGKVLVGVSGATLPTAVTTTGGVVNTMYDEFGRQIVIPNTHRKLVGSQTTPISNTTETTIITGIASTFNDLISLIISNTSTTAVRADIRDATAGSVIFSYYIPAGDTRGISLSTPWPQTTAAGNWTASLSTTPSAAVYFSATYAKNK